MQPRNLTVRALEALPRLRAILDSPAIHSLADSLERALQTAPTFLMPSGLFADRRDVATLVGLIHLPSDALFLETEHLALVAMRSPIAALPEQIIIWPVVAGGLAPTGFSVREADLPFAAENRVIATTPIHLTPDGERFLRNTGPQVYFADHLAALGELCALLACRNVSTEVIPAPVRLNLAREKRGKLPLRDYHTLILRMTETRHVGGGHDQGHASPRSHLRRGHIRRLPNGPVWVSPSVVCPGNGWVSKLYDLRA